MHSGKISKTEWCIYIFTFLLVAIFIFKSNDDTLPLAKLAQWQYGVPVLVYSAIVMLFIIGFSQLLKTFIKKKALVLGLSISIGLVLGLKSLFLVTQWIFN